MNSIKRSSFCGSRSASGAPPSRSASAPLHSYRNTCSVVPSRPHDLPEWFARFRCCEKRRVSASVPPRLHARGTPAACAFRLARMAQQATRSLSARDDKAAGSGVAAAGGGRSEPAARGPLPKRPCTETVDAPLPARRPTEAYPLRYGEGGRRSRSGCSGRRMPGSEGMAPWRPERSRVGSQNGEPRTESPLRGGAAGPSARFVRERSRSQKKMRR
jgi:hypothetical protein